MEEECLGVHKFPDYTYRTIKVILIACRLENKIITKKLFYIDINFIKIIVFGEEYCISVL